MIKGGKVPFFLRKKIFSLYGSFLPLYNEFKQHPIYRKDVTYYASIRRIKTATFGK